MNVITLTNDKCFLTIYKVKLPSVFSYIPHTEEVEVFTSTFMTHYMALFDKKNSAFLLYFDKADDKCESPLVKVAE